MPATGLANFMIYERVDERMAKLRLYAFIPFLLLVLSMPATAQYALKVKLSSPDSLLRSSSLGIPSTFKDQTTCTDYVYKLADLLHNKGFTSASVDSVQFDSAAAFLQLYIGEKFTWSEVRTRPSDAALLNQAGWSTKKMTGKPATPGYFHAEELLLLNWLENNGYPFARISLDSVGIHQGSISGLLNIEKGPLYKIDSIRINGSAKISVEFMERYLGIPEGSIYKKERLLMISRRIQELPFVQEERTWSLNMLGTGSILNLYLKPRKSSQIDVLVGLLPNSDPQSNKLLVTGEATVMLRNPFGNGENLSLDWQQLQQSSPRLNISYQQPYIFHSPYGINMAFSLYKKDSSYVNTNGLLGIQFNASMNKKGSVFIQATGCTVLTIDTAQIIATRQLPEVADVSSVNLGVTYEFNNTNYKFNAVRGNEFYFIGSAGTKSLKKNSQIIRLKDQNDPSFDYGTLYDTLKTSAYQFRLNAAGAHYFSLSNASTIRFAVNAAWYQSPKIFWNELFQIGGYRLLRGFNEESILASVYTVGSLEYRYLIGVNSFLFTFADGGWAKNDVPGYAINNIYLGIGAGLAFETKAGIFNMSYAVGKEGSNPFEVRQAKIHLGYVNFF
jgi:outer membrane translocation and assembly module TamA